MPSHRLNLEAKMKAIQTIWRVTMATPNLVAMVLTASLFAAALALPRAAEAQSVVMPRAQIVTTLGEKYAETPVALGVAGNGGVIEVFTTDDGSTFTIILTMPNGLSRVITSGEHWTPLMSIAPAA